MTHEQNDPDSLRRDVQQWYTRLKQRGEDEKERRTLRELIEDGEKRLHEIEEKKADRPIGAAERA